MYNYSEPLISIITPCLDAVNTIERTIQSVIRSEYESIQYVIVDGESVDGTLDVIDHYRRSDERIEVVSKADDSMTQALNRGLAMAEGDIIGSLNADDWHEPDALSHVSASYMKDGFDFLIGNTRYVDDEGREMYQRRPWLASWLPAWYLMGCLTPESSVFYSAECINTVGKFNEALKYTQDLEYYLRIMDSFEARHLDQTLSNFLVSDEQISTRLHDTMEKEVMSYIDYNLIRKYVGGTSLGSLLQVLSGQRVYTTDQFMRHSKQFMSKNL